MEVDVSPRTELTPPTLPLPPNLQEGSPSPPPTPTRAPRTLEDLDQSRILAFLDTIIPCQEAPAQQTEPLRINNAIPPPYLGPLPTGDPPPRATPTTIPDIFTGNSMEDLPDRPRINKQDPLAMFTNATMPKVHLHHPLSLFDYINPETQEKWWKLPGSKLLASPFEGDVLNPSLHGNIVSRLLAAATDITSSNSASIQPPPTNEEDTKAGHIPTSFIIYNLSETHRHILLQRRVWASANISFLVAPLEPSCPDFLFNIQDFATLENGAVVTMVKDIWHDEQSQEFLKSLVEEAAPQSQAFLRIALANFIDLMWITRLDIRITGNGLKPEFNIYAKGSLIPDTKIWPHIRKFLADRSYTSPELGQGNAVIAPHWCRLCHSRDHLKGLCPFPLVEGWLGPKRTGAPKQQKGGHPRRSFPRSS